MYLQHFRKTKLFRPRPSVVRSLESRFHELLLKTFGPGEYLRGTASIVLNHAFELYETLLCSLVPQIASRDALDFILFQFDQNAQIRFESNIESRMQDQDWARLEGCHGRAVKYLAELVCIEDPNRQNPLSNSNDSLLAMEGAFYCAERMAHLAEMSERVHSLFTKEAYVKVLPEGSHSPWEGGFIDPRRGFDVRFYARIDRDRRHRKAILDGELERDINVGPALEILDPEFEALFDVKLSALLWAIRMIVDGARPAKDGFPTLFLKRDSVISSLEKSGFSARAAELALQGFTLTPDDMTKARRILWNPKQEYRAYRRAFFLVRHQTGPHIAFSRSMANECFTHLIQGISYKKLPKEWRSESLKIPLESVSRSASAWFEDIVQIKLRKLNVVGGRFSKFVGTTQPGFRIPESVGELDFLGYCPSSEILILLEAKMTNTGLEAKYWRDDIEDFVLRERKSYQCQTIKKAEWVMQNSVNICMALQVPHTSKLGTAILTLYPCIAQELTILPCVSVTEFVLDWEENGKWPYSLFRR